MKSLDASTHHRLHVITTIQRHRQDKSIHSEHPSRQFLMSSVSQLRLQYPGDRSVSHTRRPEPGRLTWLCGAAAGSRAGAGAGSWRRFAPCCSCAAAVCVCGRHIPVLGHLVMDCAGRAEYRVPCPPSPLASSDDLLRPASGAKRLCVSPLPEHQLRGRIGTLRGGGRREWGSPNTASHLIIKLSQSTKGTDHKESDSSSPIGTSQ